VNKHNQNNNDRHKYPYETGAEDNEKHRS